MFGNNVVSIVRIGFLMIMKEENVVLDVQKEKTNLETSYLVKKGDLFFKIDTNKIDVYASLTLPHDKYNFLCRQ